MGLKSPSSLGVPTDCVQIENKIVHWKLRATRENNYSSSVQEKRNKEKNVLLHKSTVKISAHLSISAHPSYLKLKSEVALLGEVAHGVVLMQDTG